MMRALVGKKVSGWMVSTSEIDRRHTKPCVLWGKKARTANYLGRGCLLATGSSLPTNKQDAAGRKSQAGIFPTISNAAMTRLVP